MLDKQDSSYFPKGTKITLVDLTSMSMPMYFFYQCDANTTSINLFDFVQMGSTTTLNVIANDGNSANDPAFLKLYQANLLTRITERLIFVFDFSEAQWEVASEFSGFITLEHIYNSHDILDYVSSNEEVIDGLVHVTYNRVAPKGEKLIARAICKKNGRSSSIINVDVVDDTGRDIVQFVGTGFKL